MLYMCSRDSMQSFKSVRLDASYCKGKRARVRLMIGAERNSCVEIQCLSSHGGCDGLYRPGFQKMYETNQHSTREEFGQLAIGQKKMPGISDAAFGRTEPAWSLCLRSDPEQERPTADETGTPVRRPTCSVAGMCQIGS